MGDRREKIFLDDVDRHDFIKTLAEASFKRDLLFKMGSHLGDHHSGELRRRSAEAKAERIMAEELQQRGWRPGGTDPAPSERSGEAGDCRPVAA